MSPNLSLQSPAYAHMLSSEFVESIKSLLNRRTYHSKPLCLTLPSDIFTLVKSKWEGLSMYFSFCYMFMGRYISLTKGKLFPGLVILCNVGIEGQLKQRPVPKCYWYFMHKCKEAVTSLPCSSGGDKLPVFFFFQKFLCTLDIKNQTPQRHIPSRLLQFFRRILPAAGQGEFKRAFPPKISIKIKSSGTEKMSMWAK